MDGRATEVTTAHADGHFLHNGDYYYYVDDTDGVTTIHVATPGMRTQHNQ